MTGLDPVADFLLSKTSKSRDFGGITSVHTIQPILEFLLQSANILDVSGLLWSRILCSPLCIVIRDGNSVGPLSRLILRVHGLAWLLHPDHVPKAINLLQDHLTHLRDVFDNLKAEIKGLRTGRLVGDVMPDVEVAVLESFFDRYSTGGV